MKRRGFSIPRDVPHQERMTNVVVVVHVITRVQLFVTPWTSACQDSLFFTISQSLVRFISVESEMPSNVLSSATHFSSCLQSFPASGSFPMSQLFASAGQSIGASASASPPPNFM